MRADYERSSKVMMLDVMYEVPSRDDVSSCLITEKVVQEKIMPELTPKKGKKKEESA